MQMTGRVERTGIDGQIKEKRNKKRDKAERKGIVL